MIKKLLGKNILLERCVKSNIQGGLYIPNAYQNEPLFGIVMAIGDGVKKIKKGNRVLFKKYAPDEIELDGKEYLICVEEDVIGIME